MRTQRGKRQGTNENNTGRTEERRAGVTSTTNTTSTTETRAATSQAARPMDGSTCTEKRRRSNREGNAGRQGAGTSETRGQRQRTRAGQGGIADAGEYVMREERRGTGETRRGEEGTLFQRIGGGREGRYEAGKRAEVRRGRRGGSACEKGGQVRGRGERHMMCTRRLPEKECLSQLVLYILGLFPV